MIHWRDIVLSVNIFQITLVEFMFQRQNKYTHTEWVRNRTIQQVIYVK